MNKFLKKIISATVCTAMLFNAAISVSAEKITVDSDFPIHGNKCGEVIVSPEINRDVYVKITQYSPDGNYIYYDSVIPAVGASKGTNDYSFMLEGKDDVSYEISIGVPKYSGTTEALLYTYEFTVNDTDNIVDETLNGYLFTFKISGDEEFKEPTVIENESAKKNSENIIVLSRSIAFPISDVLLGDVNFDGLINLHDCIEISKYLLDSSRFTESQIKAGDYNGNGKVDLQDAVGIAKFLIKK